MTLLFETAEQAKDFATRHSGVYRLIETERHVYTNWAPVLQKRSFHARMNPFDWANRDISYSPDMCAQTLAILARTCQVGIPYSMPLALVRRRSRSLLQ